MLIGGGPSASRSATQAERALRPWRLSALAAGIAVALWGAAALAGGTAVIDATGRKVEIGDASRIVSIGGAVTEILYALGAEDRIAAVDSTSLFPRAALAKPNVGYMRQLSAEGVLGLNPTLVLAVEGSGPKETMAVLASARVPLVLVPDRYTGDGVLDRVRTVAQAVDAREQGACLTAAVQRDLDSLATLRERISKPLKVLFVLSFMHGRPMVAGTNTAADGIIRLAGGVNAVDAYQGYKPINDEAVIAASPDAVLVMQRAGATLDADAVFAHPAFSLTPAAARRAFVSMDGLYLLGFGPRTALAARDLASALYPDLGQALMPSEQREPGRCR